MRKIFSFFAAMLVAFVANAATINIDNTTPDALRTALANAADGDEIVMAAGTYVESNANFIAFDGKNIVVKAAEGAEVILQPQVSISVSGGGCAHFQNIKIDASHIHDADGAWYEHIIYSTDATANNRIILEGCELYGFPLNNSLIYCGASNKLASVTINNCYFHNLMKSILFVENTTEAINVQVKNSTFANISTNTESYWAGIIDLRAAAAQLLVDHCTFYNVIPMNTDYSCVSKITLANGVTSNCIFMLPTAQDGIRAMRGVAATNCITFNYLKDSGTGIHSSVTQTNCQQVDPAFVNAANGDFTLGEGSPALTMNDGQPIGDPRWFPVIGAPAYYLVGTMNNWTPADEYKFEENPGAPGEYMLTAALTVGDEIKVKGIVGATETWYPAGTDNNYVVDADHAGEWKKIYFRPEGQGGEDWHYGFFFVEENPAPVVEFDTIYTWYGKRGESTATEAIEKGGVATAEGGNSNIVVGTAQKTNWTIKLNKGFSNANYVGITLNEALKAGDQMQLAAFIASDNTAVLGIDFSESKEAASTDCQLLFSNLQLISTNAAPEDTLFTIPAAAAGAKYIRVYRNSGQTGVYIANITILRNGDTPEPPAPEPKFCVTGDSALVVDAGAEASKAWAADAVPSMTDTLVLNLKANQYYVLKLVDGANWLGYHDLSEVAPGLVEDSPEEYHNIGFTLAEAGEVKVIYTEGVPNKIFKLEGNFYVEPVAGCDWDNIDFLADASIEQAFANQFKVCKDGAEPNVANVQSPDWADTTGIYVNFPDAVIGEISLPEGQYKQQGAGILLYVTAFTLKETEFTIQWQDGIYTLTVLNVNGEEPEPEHTYTVVGDELVFGSNWNPEDVANDMAKQEDGSYKWTADSIVLIANTYAYKIVKDHSWAGEWPVGQGNNKTFAIAETGYYDVTITFNPEAAEAEKAVVEAVKVGDAVVLPTVAMHGDFTGSWKDTELFTNAADSSCASLKLNLEAKTYEFGMRIGSASNWTANSANLTRENPSTVLSVGASGNMHIVADQAGEYTFTYFYDADSLVVTYPKLYMHYGVAEAIAAAADSVLVKDDLVYIRGIVTKIEFKGKNFAKYGSACIYVADAAGAADTLEFYNCYSMNADTFKTSDPAYDATSTAWAQFNSVSDANGNTVALGDVVEAFGKYNLYNGVHQLNQGCYITEIHTPSVAPTTAPAAPTQAEEDVMAIYCDYYKTNNLHFGISGWAGAYETLNIEDTKIAYWKAMTWECVIDPVNTDSIHDLSAYKKLHVDFWAPAAAKIKFTAEAVAGGNYKDGVVLDLAEGWTSWDIEIATWPGQYDFANLKCLVLEQYQTPEGASFEGNPFAVANIYFYDKKAEGFENIDASVKAVKVLQNGQIFILRGDKVYTVTGQPIAK